MQLNANSWCVVIRKCACTFKCVNARSGEYEELTWTADQTEAG